MITPDMIKLYPMSMDVNGSRTHEEYVDTMAKIFVDLYYDYRLDYSAMQLLVMYAEQEHERLSKGTT